MTIHLRTTLIDRKTTCRRRYIFVGCRGVFFNACFPPVSPLCGDVGVIGLTLLLVADGVAIPRPVCFQVVSNGTQERDNALLPC